MPSIAEILNVDYVVQDDLMASWRHALEPEFDLPYMRLLQRKLMKEERDGHDIYPPADKIFEALRITARCESGHRRPRPAPPNLPGTRSLLFCSKR